MSLRSPRHVGPQAMSEQIKDVIISVPTSHTAQLEAWLLGHGFPVDHQSESADGAMTFYSVTDLSADGRNELKLTPKLLVSGSTENLTTEYPTVRLRSEDLEPKQGGKRVGEQQPGARRIVEDLYRLGGVSAQ